MIKKIVVYYIFIIFIMLIFISCTNNKVNKKKIKLDLLLTTFHSKYNFLSKKIIFPNTSNEAFLNKIDEKFFSGFIDELSEIYKLQDKQDKIDKINNLKKMITDDYIKEWLKQQNKKFFKQINLNSFVNRKKIFIIFCRIYFHSKVNERIELSNDLNTFFDKLFMTIYKIKRTLLVNLDLKKKEYEKVLSTIDFTKYENKDELFNKIDNLQKEYKINCAQLKQESYKKLEIKYFKVSDDNLDKLTIYFLKLRKEKIMSRLYSDNFK